MRAEADAVVSACDEQSFGQPASRGELKRRLRGRGQRQHEVLQAIAQVVVVVLVYHPLANVPSEQLLS